MKVKHNKQNSETLNRLRDQSRNLNPDQLRQFIHKELEKKTRVRDINEALNIPRATVYRIKKNPTLKAKGRKQLNSNLNRLYILHEYLENHDFSVRKKSFVDLLKKLIQQNKFQNTTKIYDEYQKTQILFTLLIKYLENLIRQQLVDFQLDKNNYRYFLKLLIEKKIDFIIDNKAQEIIFENQELVQEIFQECIKKFQNHYSFFESQDSDNFIDQNVFSQQIPACSQLYQQINYQSLEYLDQEDQLHYYQQNSQFQNSHSDNHQYENQILDFEMNQIYTSELNQQYLNTEESHFLSKNQSWQFY